ncbi:arginine/serine-rich coiled-coil protein 2-like [Petromyzon marinus]
MAAVAAAAAAAAAAIASIEAAESSASASASVSASAGAAAAPLLPCSAVAASAPGAGAGQPLPPGAAIVSGFSQHALGGGGAALLSAILAARGTANQHNAALLSAFLNQDPNRQEGHQHPALASNRNLSPHLSALLAAGSQVSPQVAFAAQMAALQAATSSSSSSTSSSTTSSGLLRGGRGVAMGGTAVGGAAAGAGGKRKLLWQGRPGERSATKELWENLNFGSKDQNTKFRKLMGIHGKQDDEEGGEATVMDVAAHSESTKALQKQEEVFRDLDAQYSLARAHTHTQRGTGLGFHSRSFEY